MHTFRDENLVKAGVKPLVYNLDSTKVRMCIRIYVHTCIHTHTDTKVRMCIRIYVRCVFLCVCIFVWCVFVCVRVYAYARGLYIVHMKM